MLHTDIPTEPEFRGLDAVRGDICVSIYLPTTPVTREARRDQILFKNLVTDAVNQLKSGKANKRKIAAVEAALLELHDDEVFWAYMADGLAVFATPNEMRTFRLPVAPSQAVEVSDRFHIKPLVPPACQGSWRGPIYSSASPTSLPDTRIRIFSAHNPHRLSSRPAVACNRVSTTPP